jgi:hypothetical protein
LPFPLREKSGARKNKKCKGNFSARLRALARAVGLRFGFGSGGSASPLEPPAEPPSLIEVCEKKNGFSLP